MWVVDFLIFTLCCLSGITTLGLVTDSLLDHAAVTSSPKSLAHGNKRLLLTHMTF